MSFGEKRQNAARRIFARKKTALVLVSEHKTPLSARSQMNKINNGLHHDWPADIYYAVYRQNFKTQSGYKWQVLIGLRQFMSYSSGKHKEAIRKEIERYAQSLTD